MAKIITAPNYVEFDTEESVKYSGKHIFLAGGITNCKDWQKIVIEKMEDYDVVLYNPRRENFDITNPSATEDQIKWEFDCLENCDIFTMYFCRSESDQPICMYELGRNIVRMQQRFPEDWFKRIIITIESGYSRESDVINQVKLATNGRVVVTKDPYAPYALGYHVANIINAIKGR